MAHRRGHGAARPTAKDCRGQLMKPRQASRRGQLMKLHHWPGAAVCPALHELRTCRKLMACERAQGTACAK
eukprot:14759043-Alexandrium_andersonii.AAC.1